MTIPWQAVDSSEQGILQEERRPPGWDATWSIDGNWLVLNWLEGQGLQDFLQQWIAAVAHLDGTLVRPRWQPEPPTLPEFDVPCWAAAGITRQRPIGTYAWVGHKAEGDGYSELQRHEEIEVLASFYGNESDEYAGRMHSNVSVWQNIALLRLVGLAFVDCGEAVWAPELVKQKWFMRVDKRLTFRRIVWRRYPILTVLEAPGIIHSDPGGYQRPFNARQ
ncbi:MAG: hypothetical protein C5B60_02525 [Chloroflexi bacterium]|nr:MAG: hypothetical protein C5B60_02525 [Chloroflexota bacterium]